MSDHIEKHIELKAPVSRVWRALIDHHEFGDWFGVKLEGPFQPGATIHGRITHIGYEHVKWEAVVHSIEPERLFSFTWHPYAVDPKIDYAAELPTLVEFKLAPVSVGTLLTISETGFEKIPASRRAEAFRMNEGGWTAQIENIERHVRLG